MTGSDAIFFVQAKRSIVCPNLGFRSQLDIYATRFMGKKSTPKTERIALRRAFLGTVVRERIRQLTAARGTNGSSASESDEVSAPALVV